MKCSQCNEELDEYLDAIHYDDALDAMHEECWDDYYEAEALKWSGIVAPKLGTGIRDDEAYEPGSYKRSDYLDRVLDQS